NVGKFVGTGLAMEAIENDPVFYELATDLTWRTPALIDWIDDYVCQRYGLSDAPPSAREAATEAWEGLLSTLYRSGATRAIPSPLIVRPADFDPLLPEPHGTEQAGEPGPAAEFSLDMAAETAPHVEDDLPTMAAPPLQMLPDSFARWEELNIARNLLQISSMSSRTSLPSARGPRSTPQLLRHGLVRSIRSLFKAPCWPPR